MNVLIVEDNAPMRRMIHDLIAPLAEQIFECEDGRKAVEIYSRFFPDWVLMDVEMKQMDGLTATRQIISKFPEARILIFTQYDDDELRATAKEAGARGFVLKDDLQMLRAFLTQEQLTVAKHR